MKTVSVRLEWREEGQEIDSAEVAGDFNQWEKVPLFLQCEEDESVWWTMLEIMPGCYSYKFLIDGEWKNAPGAEVDENKDGELVSVLIVEEEDDEEGDNLEKSKEKLKEKPKPPPVSPPCPPSPGPRQDFPGKNGAKAFLVAGQPMDLRLAKLTKSLPLSSGFNGCHLAVVHTPADWGPHEIFSIADKVKKVNKEAGLDSFVLLVGTGLQNVHMSIEALQRHTKHTQFLTFHRSDANLGEETGKLRETCSYFLVAYFFPGSEVDGSVLPAKMVRDGYTTCFVTYFTLHLESSIIDCFLEEGQWLLDIACGSSQLSVAALERGRSSVALHAELDALEDLGNYLRTVSLEVDPTYRKKDGIVGLLSA